jgi:ABC-2 type transport system ATP-binding protein
MLPVSVKHIAKSFRDVDAVVDVSFDVHQGEIFGLLGPNGAGKTTTIRIMLDIFKADRGEVAIFGGLMSEDKKDLIGYMPEERGLYQDISLERGLMYLSSLKGVQPKEASERLNQLLERFSLAEFRKKQINELSKGMQQKAQIINTILHRPKLVIIDEPFTALDPINTQLVKDLMLELREEGVTIIMSTHQMHQVEALCDRILLINRGRDVLYGNLDQISKQYAGHAVLVRTNSELPGMDCIDSITSDNGSHKLTLKEDTDPQLLLSELLHAGVQIDKFEIAIPPLDEIFIRVVEEGGRDA